MDLRGAIGACLPIFLLAVIFDITGIVLLFLGIFANLRLDGLFYGDFLIYTGSIVLFFSLGLWLIWYLGNVPAPYDPLTGVGKSNSFVELARKISRRLSEKLKTEVMGGSKDEDQDRDDDEDDEAGNGKLKPGRVTWGKSTAYVNKGYEQDAGESVDGPEDQKTQETNDTVEDEDESEDVKTQENNDTVEDEDESEDLKKRALEDGNGDDDDDDVKKPKPDDDDEEEKPDDKALENAGDTEETSFER